MGTRCAAAGAWGCRWVRRQGLSFFVVPNKLYLTLPYQYDIAVNAAESIELEPVH